MDVLLDRAALFGLLADGVMIVHLGFIVFVGIGGLLALWRAWVAWLHIPCAVYGAAISFFGWVCPLTPLEQSLRRRAGEGGYSGGFIEHYVSQVIYPTNWQAIHLPLGILVLTVNAALYAWLLRRRPSMPRPQESGREAGG